MRCRRTSCGDAVSIIHLKGVILRGLRAKVYEVAGLKLNEGQGVWGNALSMWKFFMEKVDGEPKVACLSDGRICLFGDYKYTETNDGTFVEATGVPTDKKGYVQIPTTWRQGQEGSEGNCAFGGFNYDITDGKIVAHV